MSTLSEKTKVPVAVVATLLGVALPAYGVFSTARADVEYLKREVAGLQSKAADQDAGINDVKRDVAVIRAEMKNQTDTLKEIRTELRRGRP